MSKKLLAIFMALIMVLGSTVMAGAEEVPTDGTYEEIENSIFENLPEELADAEYDIIVTGGDYALENTRDAYPAEVQSMIDEGELNMELVDDLVGVEATVMVTDIVTAYYEDENGVLNNTVELLASYNSSSLSTGWKSYAANNYNVAARLSYIKYSNDNGTKNLIRPVTLQGTYTSSANPDKSTELRPEVSLVGSVYNMSAYFNGTGSGYWDTFTYSPSISSPSPGVIYSQSTGYSTTQGIEFSHGYIGVTLFNGSTRLCDFDIQVYL